ncbi:MAG: hypothetical protein WAX69_19855 [Victivallales bacterium]
MKTKKILVISGIVLSTIVLAVAIAIVYFFFTISKVPFSDAELYNHYLGKDLKSVKGFTVYYASEITVQAAYFKVVVDDEKEVDEYVKREYSQLKIDEDNIREAKAITKRIKWWISDMPLGVEYYKLNNPIKRKVDYGRLFWDKKNKTIYAEFGNIYN